MRSQQLTTLARCEPLVALIGAAQKNSDPAADRPGEADLPDHRAKS